MNRQKRRRSKNFSTGSTTSFTDASMYSAVESDVDTEFCDVSNSDEDETLNNSRFFIFPF